jgi:hypothetical protein
MRILKGLFVSLCVTLLSLALLGTAWSYIGLKTIHNRDTVKGWLNDSSFYDTVADTVLDNVKDESGRQGDDIPVDDARVKTIVKQVFSPDFLKQNSEAILDSTYAWLNGDSNTLSFSVDLSSARQQLATSLGAYATEKAAALPACTAATQITGDFDAFKATCLPPGVTAQAAGQEVTSQLLENDEFLNKTTFSGNDITINDNGTSRPFTETDQAKAARKAYQLSSFLPIALAIISLLLALIIFFVSPSHWQGLRRIGVTLISNGFILGISYLIVQRLPGAIDKSINTTDAKGRLISNIVRTIAADLKEPLLAFTIGFIALGIILIVLGAVLNGRKGKPAKTDNEAPHSAATASNPETPGPEKPAVTDPAIQNPTDKPTTAPTLPTKPMPRPVDKPKTPRKIQL